MRDQLQIQRLSLTGHMGTIIAGGPFRVTAQLQPGAEIEFGELATNDWLTHRKAKIVKAEYSGSDWLIVFEIPGAYSFARDIPYRAELGTVLLDAPPEPGPKPLDDSEFPAWTKRQLAYKEYLSGQQTPIEQKNKVGVS